MAEFPNETISGTASSSVPVEVEPSLKEEKESCTGADCPVPSSGCRPFKDYPEDDDDSDEGNCAVSTVTNEEPDWDMFDKYVFQREAEPSSLEKKEAILDLAASIKDDDDVGAVGLPNKQLDWKLVDKPFFKSKAEIPTEPKLFGLIRLAEKAFKSHNFISVIQILKEFLANQHASLPSHSWVLAKTHYQLGVGLRCATNFKESVRSFQSAVHVIQLKVEHIKNAIEEKPAKKPKNRHDSLQEIKKLESLITDIRGVIAKTIILEKESRDSLASNVSDITHLIRKKAKLDDDE